MEEDAGVLADDVGAQVGCVDHEVQQVAKGEGGDLGEPIVVVDGRSTEAYAREHIPGALSLPHRGIDADTTASLDRSRTCVCYCDGIGCNASTKTAFKLLMLGFEVRELIGGLDWWKRDGYATEGQDPQPGKEIDCGC